MTLQRLLASLLLVGALCPGVVSAGTSGRALEAGSESGIPIATPSTLEGWPAETFSLPPSFAPTLPSGTESLRFAPGWRDPTAEDFWSYAFVMWVDEAGLDAEGIVELLEAYYDGLMLTFAGSAGREIGSDPAQIEVTDSVPGRLTAKMHVIDAFSSFEAIDVRILVESVVETEGKTILRIRLSPQPEGHGIWRSLETAIAGIEQP